MTRIVVVLIGAVFVAYFAFLVSIAIAQEQTSIWDRLDLTIGLGAEIEPDYTGSNDYEVEAEPILRAVYDDRFYIGFLEIGYYWHLRDDLTLQLGVEYEEGRERDDNDVLRDLDEIDDDAEFVAALRYDIDRWQFGVQLQQYTGRSDKGTVGFIAARYTYPFGDRLTLTPKADISFASGRHMRTEFGISQAEANRSGFRAYDPDGGFKSATGGLELSFDISDRWQFRAEAEVEYYGDEAADSPLIDDFGSRVTYEAGAAIVYRF